MLKMTNQCLEWTPINAAVLLQFILEQKKLEAPNSSCAVSGTSSTRIYLYLVPGAPKQKSFADESILNLVYRRTKIRSSWKANQPFSVD